MLDLAFEFYQVPTGFFACQTPSSAAPNELAARISRSGDPLKSGRQGLKCHGRRHHLRRYRKK